LIASASNAFVVPGGHVVVDETGTCSAVALNDLGMARGRVSTVVLAAAACDTFVVPRGAVVVDESGTSSTVTLDDLVCAARGVTGGILMSGAVFTVVVFSGRVPVDKFSSGSASALHFLSVTLVVFLVLRTVTGHSAVAISGADSIFVAVVGANGAPSTSFITASNVINPARHIEVQPIGVATGGWVLAAAYVFGDILQWVTATNEANITAPAVVVSAASVSTSARRDQAVFSARDSHVCVCHGSRHLNLPDLVGGRGVE